MSDRYIDFANSSIGHRLVGALACLRRCAWNAGKRPPASGRRRVADRRRAAGGKRQRLRQSPDRCHLQLRHRPSLATAWIPGHGPKLKAVVFDATHLVQTDQLKQLREFFQP
jgi:3-oxoacyl-[acyl-carrier protein] reductase